MASFDLDHACRYRTKPFLGWLFASVVSVRNRGNQPYTISGLAMTPTLCFGILHVFTSLEHYLFGRLACYSTVSPERNRTIKNRTQTSIYLEYYLN